MVANAPFCQAQRHDAGIHIAGAANLRIDKRRADGENFDGLAATQEAHHVEVVNGHVQKNAAGDFHVGDGRRRGITTGDPHLVGCANLSGGHQFARFGEAGIEAAVEADLEFDARLADSVERLLDPLQIQVNGLLAEDVFPLRRPPLE